MTVALAGSPPMIGRLERFASVGSTNDVVRDWLAAGEPEICVAIADHQSAGRGRNGRSWVAPAGAAILGSFGFRPGWLPLERIWQLAAAISLAMAEAAESEAGLPPGTIGLKWPNDLVAVVDRSNPTGEPSAGPAIRKLGGVLGEGAGVGTGEPTVIVGIGFNASWHPDRFPPELHQTMSSLHELAPGGAVDAARLLLTFLDGVRSRIAGLHSGAFDADEWAARQVTTGRLLEIETEPGTEVVRGAGVDPATGALIVGEGGAERSLFVGEIRHVRLAAV